MTRPVWLAVVSLISRFPHHTLKAVRLRQHISATQRFVLRVSLVFPLFLLGQFQGLMLPVFEALTHLANYYAGRQFVLLQ
jgi:hypothetical protein